MDWDLIRTTSGYQVPVRWYPARQASRGALIMMPALGVSAAYYHHFVEALADGGISTLLMEQRGHGESALTASRQVDWGHQEIINEDLNAVVPWVREESHEPLVLAGHSLGGHLAMAATASLPHPIHGLALIACSNPFPAYYSALKRLQLRFLVPMLPIFRLALGYYPGHWLGFGDREAGRLMKDWSHLARYGTFKADGVEIDLEAGMATFDRPVLAVGFKDDDLAPVAARRAMTDKLRAAAITEVELNADELGCSASHFAWARKPRRTADEVVRWFRGFEVRSDST